MKLQVSTEKLLEDFSHEQPDHFYCWEEVTACQAYILSFVNAYFKINILTFNELIELPDARLKIVMRQTPFEIFCIALVGLSDVGKRKLLSQLSPNMQITVENHIQKYANKMMSPPNPLSLSK